MFDLIEFQRILKKTIILGGFDPYSPLYYLIRDQSLKLVSLAIFLSVFACFQ